jgi:hypothetical protein
MAETYKFTFTAFDPETGEEESTVEVDYFRATVRTSLEARRIQGKLLDAYGHMIIDAPPVPRDEWDNISEYSTAMSQCKSSAAWWTNSNATPAQVRAAYELFFAQDPDLFDKFVEANRATMPQKKMKSITLET